jgi:hypothetical protein
VTFNPIAPVAQAVELRARRLHDAECTLLECGRWPEHRHRSQELVGGSMLVGDWPVVLSASHVACARCSTLTTVDVAVSTSMKELEAAVKRHLADSCSWLDEFARGPA